MVSTMILHSSFLSTVLAFTDFDLFIVPTSPSHCISSVIQVLILQCLVSTS